MSNPRRKSEHWSRFEFELLRSARGDAPAPGARKRVLVAFAAGGSGALASSAGARAAVGAASKTAAPLATGAKFVVAGAGKWIALALLGAGAIGAVGHFSLGSLLTAHAAPTATSFGPDLAAEMASLDAARVALRTKQTELALRALDDYARAFPRGALAPEAMVLRIDALTARGDRGDAAALRKVFLEAFPKSPHSPRVRAALGL
jgi:TolA-binding protein